MGECLSDQKWFGDVTSRLQRFLGTFHQVDIVLFLVRTAFYRW